MSTLKKAIILLSGGLDSTTCLAMAKAEGFACYALSFDYGQRHAHELSVAAAIAAQFEVVLHRVVHLDVGQFGTSALTDSNLAVPEDDHGDDHIPVTYVPARNTIFLAIALGFAESVGAYDLFIGANAIDYSNYPDCRPAFIDAFQTLANLATKAGVEGQGFTIHAPLLHLSKAQIIKAGMDLGVDYGKTVSCYQLTDEGTACGRCASCQLRQQGFAMAGIPDPTHYQ